MEADQASIHASGAQVAGDALIRSELASAFLGSVFDFDGERRTARDPRKSPRPFHDLMALLPSVCEIENAARWLERALKRPREAVHSHPALSERLKSLGVDARVPRRHTSVASSLLGRKCVELETQFDAEWRLSFAETEKARAERGHILEKELESLRKLEKPGRRSCKRLAEVLAELGRRDEAARAFRELANAEPRDASVRFNAGALRLAVGDSAGIGDLERAVHTNPRYAVAANQLIAAFHDRRDDDEAAAVYRRRARVWVDHLGADASEHVELRAGDDLLAAPLDLETRAVLSRAVDNVEGVRATWAVRKTPPKLPEQGVNVLVIDVAGEFGLPATRTERRLRALTQVSDAIPLEWVVTSVNGLAMRRRLNAFPAAQIRSSGR